MKLTLNNTLINNINTLGQNVKLPEPGRNYCIFNNKRIEKVALSDDSLPYIKEILQNTNDEKKLLETLAVVDKIAERNPDEAKKMYPYLSRLNDTNSPNIQVMLSGIYRKSLVPDAFGPLTRMLYKQTVYPNSLYFDPTEETGGAILEYIKSWSAVDTYKTH